MSALSVAILTGGQATRFGGRDKGALIVGGASILARQIAALAPLTDDLLLVGSPNNGGRSQTRSSGATVRVVADIVPGSGPLGGIHAALTEARGDRVLVVACDMPYLTTDFAAYLAAQAGSADVVVPSGGGRLHPLCAVYGRACLDLAARMLAERRLALHDLIAQTSTRIVAEEDMIRFGAPSRLLANVNTPAEYADLEALQDHEQ